ncbi:capping protein-inhibiting regulator of actin dynamics isoform X3 [Channa argus]|uniref:capping protein-inhibiting regulator of actin dynamics isoform X3 n=1 Tax=Channa argus TaxID=215402 RepID=UPI003521EECC
MSWFQSLRDDFTLRPPFDTEQARSDRAAMASGPPDVMTNQEPTEVQEECPAKKKSKFQTFKKFFARKKRKEPSAAGADAGLKASQSSDNVSKTSENNTLTRSEKDKGSGSKISLGSKALSHDSVFVSDSSEANDALGASQDSIHGKVKSLQLQLKQAIKLGSPPSLICVKGRDDAGTMSEDDGLPCSPPEYTTLPTVMTLRDSSISLERENQDDDQLSCAASSRVASPLVVPGDFSQPASPYGCLDNSAAKHKMGLRQKACNKRKPVNRLEMKPEWDMDADEVLNNSTTEALVEQEKQKEVIRFDELKSKVEREEEEEEEEMKEQPKHSTQSPLRDKEEGEEGEEELEAEQDVSHRADASPPQLGLTDEHHSDAQPLPSSEHSSAASSLDSARVTPEPPAGVREYLLDPACVANGAEENRAASEFALSEEEDRVQESRGDESSLLQEVLSSLKTPLAPCSLGMEVESVGLMETVEEVKEKERQEADVEEGEDMKEGEAEVDEELGYQAAPSGTILLGQTTKEEEQVASPSCQEEVVVPEEEVKEHEETEKKGEVVVERFSQHGQEEAGEKGEADEVKPEEKNNLLRIIDIQAEEEVEEEYQSEGEEEAIELDKEPGVEEEGQEKTEEGDQEVEVKEETDKVEEAEEAIEEESDDAEEMTERFSDTADEEAQISLPLQEADEGVDVVVGDDTVCTTNLTDDAESPAELSDEEFTIVQECQANSDLNSGEEAEEEVVEIEHMQQREEDVETNLQVSVQTERDLKQESVEMSRLDLKQVENDQTEAAEQAMVSSRPVSLLLPESHFETQSQESGNITPSKMSTTTIHINLVSPSSDKVQPFFQQSPTAAQPKESESPSHTAAAEQTPEFTEDPVDSVEEVKDFGEEDTTPDSVEETVEPPPCSPDQSKVRFTISPAWQRTKSLTPPSSPPACVSSSPSTTTEPRSEEVEAASKEDPVVQTDPVSLTKVELTLSPGRERNAGSTAAKPQSNAATSPCCAKLQTSAASTEETTVIAEGNANNPFGVRLRKTSALQRLSSEEENTEVMTESPVEPPVQPPSCKDEPPHPVSVKPFVSQPLCNKPALPKKPELHGDSGAKTKRISEHAAGRGVSTGSDSPSWISVAKQKQKIYKENSLDEITVKKEEPERKSSLPTYISSSAGNKKAESVGKVNLLEISKHSSVASVETDARGALSPPTPVPPQPSKSVSLPCSIPPKPQILHTTAKPPPQPSPARGSLSQPTPVPVSQKSPSCTSPSSASKTTPSLPLPKSAHSPSTTVTSPPFSSRTTLESTGSRATGQTPSSQRALPPPALPQDEPPWMALAKKKAKAWSEMPQIVQ